MDGHDQNTVARIFEIDHIAVTMIDVSKRLAELSLSNWLDQFAATDMICECDPPQFCLRHIPNINEVIDKFNLSRAG